MSPLAKFQPVPHPQNLGILNTGFNRKARNAPRCQSCSKHPCFTLQFCASSPDACTHTHISSGNKSQQSAKSAQTAQIPLGSTALAKWEGAQHSNTKPLPAGSPGSAGCSHQSPKGRCSRFCSRQGLVHVWKRKVAVALQDFLQVPVNLLQ